MRASCRRTTAALGPAAPDRLRNWDRTALNRDEGIPNSSFPETRVFPASFAGARNRRLGPRLIGTWSANSRKWPVNSVPAAARLAERLVKALDLTSNQKRPGSIAAVALDVHELCVLANE